MDLGSSGRYRISVVMCMVCKRKSFSMEKLETTLNYYYLLWRWEKRGIITTGTAKELGLDFAIEQLRRDLQGRVSYV